MTLVIQTSDWQNICALSYSARYDTTPLPCERSVAGAEADRKRFLDTLRRDADFRAAVRRELLTEELMNLPQAVATLVDVVAQRRQDFTELARDVRAFMEAAISGIQAGFAEMREELGSIRAEVTEVRSEMASVRTDMESMRTDMASLRTDMASGFTAVGARLDQVDADIRDIRDKRAS